MRNAVAVAVRPEDLGLIDRRGVSQSECCREAILAEEAAAGFDPLPLRQLAPAYGYQGPDSVAVGARPAQLEAHPPARGRQVVAPQAGAAVVLERDNVR